jgi:hypothetical protein
MRRVFDAGGDNNNCMILSVLACAPKELGGCTPARAREVRNELAFMISVSAGTELGKQAHEAMRVLHAWKTANPAEFTADVSCPCADACMHIEDEAECLDAAGKFVRGHYMLGAIELPFLKAWAAQKEVHVVEVTSQSGGLDAETSAWVEAQVAQAPEGMKVAVIASDSVHYQAILPAADPESPHPMSCPEPRAHSPVVAQATRRITRSMARKAFAELAPPIESPKPQETKGWTVSDVVFAVMVGAVVWIAIRPLFFAAR